VKLRLLDHFFVSHIYTTPGANSKKYPGFLKNKRDVKK